MTTAANVKQSEGSHYYLGDQPFYEVPYADPKKGMRKATLADARKVGAVPSVTTVIRVLDKPALTRWKIEQAVLAVLTSPKLPDENTDAFVERILSTEKVQDQEMETARDRGIEIHDALEGYYQGRGVPEEMQPWVKPVLGALAAYGQLVATEKILVGPGYAGKTDLILEAPDCWWLIDYKSTRKLPDPKKGGAYSEHLLQLASYAFAYHILMTGAIDHPKPIRTANAYISTLEPGAFVICEHSKPWKETYIEGFAPLLTHWRWANNYHP